jgi:diguanylate cyclase (GGDEF)-like protein/PAS domain S-box-containing protein
MSDDFRDQLTAMHKLSEISEQFLQLTENDKIDYQRITDDLLALTGAKYATFNLYDEVGKTFNTIAISGEPISIRKAAELLGYDITKKIWAADPVRMAKIEGRTTTRFSSLADLSGEVIPKIICDTIQTVMNVGEIVLVKIMKKDIMIGDFQMFMQKGTDFVNETIIEIYSRQVGLIVTRKRTELALIESELNFRGIFEKGPIGIAYHRMVYNKAGKPIDYLFLEANRSYQRLTGVNPVGLLATQAFPGIEKDSFDWIGTFGNVAKNGTEIRFQQFFEVNKRWYDCVAYQYQQDHFVAAFFEITDKKEIENALDASEELSREIVANISEAIFILDKNGDVKYQSSNLERLFGWKSGDLMGDNYYRVCHPDDLDTLKRELSAILNEHKSKANFECKVRKKSGAYATIELTVVNLLENPHIAGILVNLHDISERKEAEEALRQSEEKFRLMAENVFDVISVINVTTGKTTYVSPSIYHFRGVTVEEAMVESFEEALTPESIDIVRQSIAENTRKFIANPTDRHYYVSEIQQYRKDGSVIWVELSARYQYNAKGEIEILTISRDISERKVAEKERIFMSYNDHLTGLYNRRFFEIELDRLDTERNLPISIIMGDVNGLKFINDSFGHSAGDELLVKTASIFKKFFREDEIIARLGGDEFIVLLPKTGATEAQLIVDRIGELISKAKVANINLSISFGFDTKTRKEEDIDEIVKRAEDSMYRYKLYDSKSLRSKTIDVIMNALIEKSDRELMHSKRVSLLCEKIAVELGYKQEHINQIRLAGLVHDIGKIGIDETILNKAGKPNAQEWAAIVKHPEAGWRILNSVSEFSELSEYILSHHERVDGAGYPRGLAGEEIPVEARIIAIADSYDAMTSHRSYRQGISEDEAVQEIIRSAGTQFDLWISKVFVEKVLGKVWQ